MNTEIRPIQTHREYRAVEQLQREVWGLEEVEVVPDHLLLTAHKNGGLVLGAYDTSSGDEGGQMIGFVFGFVGLSSDGSAKHCSHMTGVAPDCQNQNLGYHLKMAQREHVLAHGGSIEVIEGLEGGAHLRVILPAASQEEENA